MIQAQLNLRQEAELEEPQMFAEGDKTCGCKATALIVDDDPMGLYPLELILQGVGIVCEQAHGGMQAVNQFITNREKDCCQVKFKVVFMDIEMP